MSVWRMRGALIFLTAVLSYSVAFSAPDFKQETETRLKFRGALGTMMKFLGLNKPIRSTVYLKGNRMRTDQFDAKGRLTESQIIDLDRELFITIDHENQNIQQMTFAEWKELLEAGMQDFEEDVEEAKKEKQQEDVEVKFKVEVQTPGEKKRISGAEAEKVVIKMMIEGESRQEDMEGQEPKKGGMVVTAELWMAKDLEGYDELKTFQKKLADKLGFAPGAISMKEILEKVMKGSPELAEAMSEIKKQEDKLDGVPLETRTIFEVWGESQESEESAEIPKSVGGLLKGFGKKFAKPKKKKESQRTVLLETITRTLNAESGSLADDLFALPKDYHVEK